MKSLSSNSLEVLDTSAIAVMDTEKQTNNPYKGSAVLFWNQQKDTNQLCVFSLLTSSTYTHSNNSIIPAIQAVAASVLGSELVCWIAPQQHPWNVIIFGNADRLKKWLSHS